MTTHNRSYRLGTAFALCTTLVVQTLLVALPAYAVDTPTPPPTPSPLQSAPQIADATIQEVPTPVIRAGVTNFTRAGNRIFWHSAADCPVRPPTLAAPQVPQPAAASPAAAADPVLISRLWTTGSSARTIFLRNDPRSPGTCNPYKILSNIVADEQYLYWVDATGLVRLSVNANPGDSPDLFSPNIHGQNLELAIGPDAVYGLMDGHIWGIKKDSPGGDFAIGDTDSPTNLSFDGQYLYFITAGNLRRMTPEGAAVTLGSGVTSYYAEGYRKVACNPYAIYCSDTTRVFIAKGSKVRLYSNLGGYDSFFYESSDAGTSIERMTSDGSRLFIFEKRTRGCGGGFCFPSYTDYLQRVPIASGVFSGEYGGPAEDLYIKQSGSLSIGWLSNLATDGSFLYWMENEGLSQLPNDVAALPKINLRPTGFEITQGIQRSDNSVTLVQNRDTIMRVFVKSDGADVPNVGAQLTASWAGVPNAGTILPRERITIKASPDRFDVNQSFTFQLPYEWTRRSDLQLRFDLNPFRFPLEPNYGDNTASYGPFSFKPAPVLKMVFAEFEYSINNKSYKADGTLINVAWINRVYPLGYTISGDDWNPGLDYDVWEINDAGLGRRVARMSPECDAYLVKNADGSVKADKRELCASDYTNSRLKAIRGQRNVRSTTFVYGMIANPPADSGGQFPRGQAGGDRVSSGPDGVGWYAGHEVGHTLGLGHPKAGDKECDLDGSDPQPSYPHAHIGPDDNSINGFDTGSVFGGSPAVLKGSTTYDMMAYCQSQWISDVNYERLYQALPKPGAALAQAEPQAVEGDLLSVYGTIVPESNAAEIHDLRRVTSVSELPARVPGAYSIRLRDAANSQIADYPFTADEGGEESGAVLPFGQVVDFMAGARSIQIVGLADGKVLATQAISASKPTIGGVALQGASEPVSGLVQLAWTASDADGDLLSFDIFYSRDGGFSFKPLQLGVKGSSVEIDSAKLGGGSGIFRMATSDGVNSAEADSPAYRIAATPPQMRIVTPGDGARLQWGQTVSFSGEARDLQDGNVAVSGMIWTDAKGAVLGTGPSFTTSALPGGTSSITLTATNSAGLAGSASITVNVGDDQNPLPPTLSVAPTQVSLSAAAGATAPQKAVVRLANIGGGSLSWSVSSNAAWLTTDVITDTTPASITLSTDPTGQADGTAAQARLTFTVVGSEGASQTLELPVMLYLGNAAFDPPPVAGLAERWVLLPVLLR